MKILLKECHRKFRTLLRRWKYYKYWNISIKTLILTRVLKVRINWVWKFIEKLDDSKVTLTKTVTADILKSIHI